MSHHEHDFGPMWWKKRRTEKLFPHAAVRVRVKIKDRVKFRVRVRIRARARVEVRVKVRVSVSYIMTIWRWEKFSTCDKFPTTQVSNDTYVVTGAALRL